MHLRHVEPGGAGRFWAMISLRKAIESHTEELLRSALGSYASSLVAAADAGALACPPEGESLKVSLLNLCRRLNQEASVEAVAETGEAVNGELHAWGERAAQFYQQKVDEVREVLAIVAEAAAKVADRDDRYAKQFGELSGRLESTARLNDLSLIRKALVLGVTELKAHSSRMVQEGQESVGKLRSQIASYEARLQEVERLASQDSLTGLANRREMERQIERRVVDNRPFGLICLDLNRFKQVNDSLGHAAGDALLCQFAQELKMSVRSTDIACRWGGDEFLILVDGEAREAESRTRRIEEWVNGEYTFTSGNQQHKVNISAATGIAIWNPGEDASQVVQRADAAMYQQKSNAPQPVTR